MPARQKAPDGAEPLIIQEGGEPTSSDDKPTDKSGSGPAKERPTANDPADRTDSDVVKDRVGQNKSEPQRSRRSGDHVRQRLALHPRLISARMGKGSRRSRRR